MARLVRPGLILPRGVQKPVNPAIDPRHPLSKGLVGYWHLGDAHPNPANGEFHDLVTGNNLAIANGPLAIGGGHHGGLTTFINNSVTNQNITTPNGVQTYPFSLSGWFYHISGVMPLANVSINASIWDGWYLTASTTAGWNFEAVSNTTFAPGAVGANTRANTFDHVVGVAESATKRTIYVNGVQGTVDTSSSTPARTDHQFRAGQSGVGDNAWDGLMDAVRFYNRALTAQEALKLYSEPYAGIIQQPSLYTVIASIAAATFNPGWAYGATKTIGGVF